MRIELSKKIEGIDGKPVIIGGSVQATLPNGTVVNIPSGIEVIKEDGSKVRIDDQAQEMTIADAIITACQAYFEELDKEASSDDVYWRHETGRTCYQNKDGFIELATDEISKLKERIKKTFPNPSVLSTFLELVGDKKPKTESPSGEVEEEAIELETVADNQEESEIQ